MKVKQFVFLTIILLFSYQNCSRNNFTEKTSLDSQDTDSKKLSDLQVQQVKFYTQQDREMQKGTHKFLVKTTNSYSLDPETGILAEYDESTDSLSTYCLSTELLAQMRSLVSNSSVCKSNDVVPEGTVCAQVIQRPYAEIVTPNEVIQLGYASDACGANKVDLCSDQPDVFKAWISTVQSQLPQLQCGQ